MVHDKVIDEQVAHVAALPMHVGVQ
jgi:hypothetical protein